MRNVGLAFMASAIVIACAASTWAETESEPGLGEVILRNRRRLLVLNTEWRHTGSQNANWFHKFLRELPEKRSGRTPAEWREALIYTVSLGKQKHLFYRDTGFVCERAALDALVAALRYPDPSIRELAVRHLLNDVRQKDIEACSAQVTASLGTPDLDEEWLLYGRLLLSAADRKRIVARQEAPIEVLARLGDEKSENALIHSFEQATDYFKKSKLAKKLGYVASDKCAGVLLRGLQSEVAVRGAVDERSVRLDILLALGKTFEDESLFTIDVVFLAQTSEATFDEMRGMAEYLEDVDQWVLRRTGQRAWGGKRVWFARALNTPILHEPGEFGGQDTQLQKGIEPKEKKDGDAVRERAE